MLLAIPTEYQHVSALTRAVKCKNGVTVGAMNERLQYSHEQQTTKMQYTAQVPQTRTERGYVLEWQCLLNPSQCRPSV